MAAIRQAGYDAVLPRAESAEPAHHRDDSSARKAWVMLAAGFFALGYSTDSVDYWTAIDVHSFSTTHII